MRLRCPTKISPLCSNHTQPPLVLFRHGFYLAKMDNALSRPKKPLPHVVTALLAKRKELKTLIRLCERRLKTATVELATIEAALRIVKSEIDPGSVALRPLHAAFRSETAK